MARVDPAEISLARERIHGIARVTQVRYRLGRHERADFDGVKPGADQCLDEGNALGDADRSLLVLQTVARTNLDDADGIAHQAAAGSTSASSTPSPTISPTLHLSAFNTPA